MTRPAYDASNLSHSALDKPRLFVSLWRHDGLDSSLRPNLTKRSLAHACLCIVDCGGWHADPAKDDVRREWRKLDRDRRAADDSPRRPDQRFPCAGEEQAADRPRWFRRAAAGLPVIVIAADPAIGCDRPDACDRSGSEAARAWSLSGCNGTSISIRLIMGTAAVVAAPIQIPDLYMTWAESTAANMPARPHQP